MFIPVRSHVTNSILGFDLDQRSRPPASIAFETQTRRRGLIGLASLLCSRIGLGNYAVEQTRTIDGRVTALRGAVLVVAFDGVTLPPIDDALVIKPDKGAPIMPRCNRIWTRPRFAPLPCSLPRDCGVASVAHATGRPLEVPVGEAVLGRLLDLAGAIGDRGKPFAADVPRRPDSPKPAAALCPERCDGNLLDWHQGDRPADAAGAGRQGHDVRRRRGRQDRAGLGVIHAVVERYKDISVVAGVRERSREGHEMLLDMGTSGVH
jgi:F-type H+-transporting ATPase subunit beta